MLYDSVIFDLDGTLWDMSAACVKSYNRVVSRNQISFREVTSEDIRKVTGRPHDECIEGIFTGLTSSEMETLGQETAIEDLAVIREEEANLYPGVILGLKKLSERLPLLIVSNCQKGYIETFYETSGLGALFKDQECYGNTLEMKAKNIESIIARNHLKNPVYVGDTDGDGKAARACGIPFIHVSYGFGQKIASHYSARTFEDVVSYVLR